MLSACCLTTVFGMPTFLLPVAWQTLATTVKWPVCSLFHSTSQHHLPTSHITVIPGFITTFIHPFWFSVCNSGNVHLSSLLTCLISTDKRLSYSTSCAHFLYTTSLSACRVSVKWEHRLRSHQVKCPLLQSLCVLWYSFKKRIHWNICLYQDHQHL